MTKEFIWNWVVVAIPLSGFLYLLNAAGFVPTDDIFEYAVIYIGFSVCYSIGYEHGLSLGRKERTTKWNKQEDD